MKEQDKILDNLIETLKDSQNGFKQAAESVKDPQLKAVVDEYSRQRGRFAVELRSKAQSADERDSEMSGSAAGTLHRGWINLQSARPEAMIIPFWPNASAAKIPPWNNSGRR